MGTVNFELDLLVNDTKFLLSLGNSLAYSLITVILQVILGLISAWYFQYYSNYKAAPLIMIILFMPYAVPSALAILGWRFLLEENGIISQIFIQFGARGNFLLTDFAFYTLIIVSVWQFYPFAFLAFTAKLKELGKPLLYNSFLDSRNDYERFSYFIYPQLKPIILSVVVLRLLFMMTKFDTPFLLFNTTTDVSINLLPLYIRENIFNDFMLYSAAVSTIALIYLIYRILIKLFSKTEI